MRELKGVLDEYHQEINGEFLELMQSIDGRNNNYKFAKRSK